MTDITAPVTNSEVKIPTNFQVGNSPEEQTKVMTKAQRDKEFRDQLKAAQEHDAALEYGPPKETEVAEHVIENKVDHEQPEGTVDSGVDTGIDVGDNANDIGSSESSDYDNELDNKPIPKKRLDKELLKRKELEEKYQQERESRIKFETELNLYSEAMKKLNKESDKVSEPDFDPLDNDAHNLYMRKINELEKKLDERTEKLAAVNNQNRFESDVNKQAAEFSKTHKDFDAAYRFVIEKEKDSARLIGIPDEQLDSFVMGKLQPMAHHVYNKGQSVPETIYNLAKNYGYQNKTIPPRGSNVNLKAIEKNQAKTSIQDDLQASSISLQGDNKAYLDLEVFSERMMNESGRGVDANKFRKVLNNLQNS